MNTVNYFDLIVNVEIISKLFFIAYMFFIKSSFFLYFVLVMLCNFNVFLYLIAYNFFSSLLMLVHLLNIEFTFIQYFHILLKLLKVYVYVYIIYTLLSNIKIFNINIPRSILIFFLLVYLYLLTGSFWSWLEPSWSSWWFGEDIEEMLIFIIFLNFIVLLHYLSSNYFIKNLLVYSLFLLTLSYISNLVIFTSRHKSPSYYSIINLNIWLILFAFTFKQIKENHHWYLFDFFWRYNWLLSNIFNKNLNRSNLLYIYLFDIFFIYVFFIYEIPIFFKFVSFYVNFYFFIPNIYNIELVYILVLSFFSLIAKIKIVGFYLFFILDWNVFLNNILFLNSSVIWNFHFFFYYVYIINLTLMFNVEYSLKLLTSGIFCNIYESNLDFNFIWIFYDLALNIDNLQVTISKDLLYYMFIFTIVFFLSWRLI